MILITGANGNLGRRLLRELAGAIETLSPRQRAVVELTFFEGRSYAEISEITETPVNTVKTRMFHARRRLQRLMPAWGAADKPSEETR